MGYSVLPRTPYVKHCGRFTCKTRIICTYVPIIYKSVKYQFNYKKSVIHQIIFESELSVLNCMF